MKDAVDLLNERIAELERLTERRREIYADRIAELEQAGHATLLREAEKDKRISELEAEAKGGDIMAAKDAERIAELETYIEDQTRVWLEQRKRIAELEEKLAEAQKDAERYRYGRDKCGDWGMFQECFWHTETPDAWDAVVDTAMESE